MSKISPDSKLNVLIWWCSGKSSPLPTRFTVKKNSRGWYDIYLYADGEYLIDISFKGKEEATTAVGIVINSMRAPQCQE